MKPVDRSRLLLYSLWAACVFGCVPGNTVQMSEQPPRDFAFTSTRTGNHDVFLTSVGSDSVINITNHPATDFSISWSPDGTRLLFGTDRDGNREIYVMNADGSDPKNLTKHAAVDTAPDWSHDGRKIVFISDRDVASREIYLMDADGSNVVRITENDRYEEAPALSPDGRRIAFGALAASETADETLQIFVIDVDGENEQQLTRLPGHNSAPRWSPDGKRLAFYGQVGEGYAGADIFTMAPDGTETVNLTNDAEPDWQPDWSSDGQWILFSRGPSDPLDIWIMRSDGTQRSRVVYADGRDEQPAWRPGKR